MLEQNAPISTETTAQQAESTQEVVQQAPAQVEVQQSQPTFIDSLSEELRGAKSLSNFKDVNELAKSYLHAQQLIGKRITDINPEDLKVLNSLRGIPEAADKYTLPEELPQEATQWYKQLAHEAQLTQDQAKKVLDSYIMLERAAKEKFETESKLKVESGIEDLKKEFGSAFDNRVELAKRAVTTFGGQELKDYFNETGMGNDPKLVKLFANIGKALLEDSIVEADKSTQFGITPADANNILQQRLANPEFNAAYYSNRHPGHAAALKEVKDLLDKMNQ